jgi:hypothetical protein
MAAGLALRIDTLHREAGQELHFSPSVAAKLRPIPVRPHNRLVAAIEKVLSSPWPINPLAALQPKENRVPKTAVTTLIRDAREQRT